MQRNKFHQYYSDRCDIRLSGYTFFIAGDPSNITTYCNGSFTKCQFKPDSTSTSFGISLYILGNGTWNGTTGAGDGNYNASDYFSAENHTVTFTSCFATVGIDIQGTWEYGLNAPVRRTAYKLSPESPPDIVVSKGLFENYGISSGIKSTSPWWPISITGATIDDIHGQGIIVNLGNPSFVTRLYRSNVLD